MFNIYKQHNRYNKAAATAQWLW